MPSALVFNWNVAPPAIVFSGISPVVADATFSVSWTPSVASQGQVEYGTTTAYGSTSTLETQLLTFHNQAIAGLTPGTVYHYRIKGITGGAVTGYSDDRTFSTLATYSAISVGSITATGASVTWTSNPSTTGIVDYGTTTAYGSSTSTETTTTSHTRTISGLSASTTYHFRVRGTDANGIETSSADQSFTTIASGSAYPADTTIATVTQPSRSIPAYLTPYTEGSINGSGGAQVIRITNVAGRRNGYPVRQAWSADGAYLHMERGGYPGKLLDGTTYAALGDVAWGDPRWANLLSDAASMYNVSGNALYHTDRFGFNGVATLVHTFSDCSAITIGENEGNASDDDRYWPIVGDGTKVRIYDKTTDTVVGTKNIATAAQLDNVKVSHSGAYVAICYADQSGGGTGTGTTQGTWIWDRTLSTNYGQATQGGGFHGDWCIDSGGGDVFVAAATAAQVGSTYDLWSKWAVSGSSLVRTSLLTGGGSIFYAWNRGHVSGRAIDLPNWCLMSSYDGTSAQPGHNQIGLLKLDGSGTIRPFCFDHSTNVNGGNYEWDIFACPNRDGSRATFGSDMGSGGVYGFVTGMTV